jgi:hypothetical protein
MQQTWEAMETALRVLADFNAKRHPNPADIDALRAHTGLQPDGVSLDEFACEIIQKALKRRAEVRAARSGSD